MKTRTITVVFTIVVVGFFLLNLAVPAMAEMQHSSNRTASVNSRVNNTSTVVNEPGLGEYGIGFGPGGYGVAGVGGVGGPALPYSTVAPGPGKGPGTGTNNTTKYR